MPLPAAPTTPAPAQELNGVCSFVGYKPDWTPAAPLVPENLGSPLNSMKTIRDNRNELTPATEQIYGHALLSLVKPGSSSRFMDESDAKFSLKHVAAKVVTRAEKRKAAAAAAAMAEEARLMEMGAKRAAKRVAIATRPVPSHRVVTNELRVRRF